MVEVNLYLWIGLIVGLVFSIVYINALLRRMKHLEVTFMTSMQLITNDMLQIEDKINNLNSNQETISAWLEEKFNKQK